MTAHGPSGPEIVTQWWTCRRLLDEFGFAEWTLEEFVGKAVAACGPAPQPAAVTLLPAAGAVLDLEAARRRHPSSRGSAS